MKHLPESDRNRLLDNNASGQFTGRYIKFLNGVPASVHCKKCGVQVAGFTTHHDPEGNPVRMTGPDGKAVQAVSFQQFNNYAQVRLVMKFPDKEILETVDEQYTKKDDDGNEVQKLRKKDVTHFIEGKEFELSPIVCSDCKKLIGDKDKENLWAVCLNGWHLEHEAQSATDDDMKAYFEMFKGAVPLRVEQA